MPAAAAAASPSVSLSQRLCLSARVSSSSCALLCPGSEIGAGLTGFGSLFLVLGVILLFDKALLALGNVSRRRRRQTEHATATMPTARVAGSPTCALQRGSG